MFRRPLVVTAATVAAGVGLYAVDEYYLLSVCQRSVRSVYTLSWVAYQYGANSKAWKLSDLHEEASERLLTMLRKNKGLYIKQGQAIANNSAVFPLAYQKRFVELYDDAPADPWSEIDSLLAESLGKNYQNEVFEYIDPKPLASALIAQVHRARLRKEGKEVAVKVQHPYIRKQMAADLAVYRGMLQVYSVVFDLPLAFFTQYISDQLEKEADFRVEAQNAAQLEKLIGEDKSAASLAVYIPKNFPEYCSQRVLVTEFIDGVSLTDHARLEREGYDIARIMKQYTAIFGRQIFTYGFVHSDPHPGNLLVRRRNNVQELVLLDHGLYVTLDPKFRTQYAEIWKLIFAFDHNAMQDIANSWGIGSVEVLRAAVQLKPPAGDTAKLSPYEMIKTFLGDETRFPQPLLMIQRTMRMMQNLNQTMGSPVNRINILTECALALISKDKSLGLRGWILLAKVHIGLMVSNIVFWFFRLRLSWSGNKVGAEDYIEQYMRDAVGRMGFEVPNDVQLV